MVPLLYDKVRPIITYTYNLQCLSLQFLQRIRWIKTCCVRVMLEYIQLYQSSESSALSSLMALHLFYSCHTVHSWRLSSKSVTVIPYISFGCIYYGSCFICLSIHDRLTTVLLQAWNNVWPLWTEASLITLASKNKQTLLKAYSILGTRTFHPLKLFTKTGQHSSKHNWQLDYGTSQYLAMTVSTQSQKLQSSIQVAIAILKAQRYQQSQPIAFLRSNNQNKCNKKSSNWS